MKLNYFFLSSLAMFSFLSSCSDENTPIDKNTVPDYVDISITSMQADIVKNSNSNCFSIFKQLKENPSDLSNTCFSPLSFFYVTNIIANGGETATTSFLKNYLNCSSDINNWNNNLTDLTDKIVKSDPNVSLEIASSLWYDNSCMPDNEFYSKMKKHCEFIASDLYSNKGIDDINNWCNHKTNGLISGIINEIPNTNAIVLNTTLFKGLWRNEFDKKQSSTCIFNNIDDSKSETVMMHNDRMLCKYFNDEKITAVSLPYSSGNFVFDIILPSSDISIGNFINTFSYKDYIGLITDVNLNTAEIDLAMPRFKIESESDLLGLITQPSQQIYYNVPGIIKDKDMMISFIKQKTLLEVDEKGTQAAAATVAGATISPGTVVTKVNVNRPFLYFIRETSTNTIIFAGYVVKL